MVSLCSRVFCGGKAPHKLGGTLGVQVERPPSAEQPRLHGISYMQQLRERRWCLVKRFQTKNIKDKENTEGVADSF